MNNEQIAGVLRQMADLLEMKGEVRFKVVAFQKVARAVAYATDDVEQLASEGRLKEIPGVGKGIASKIDELLSTGRIEEHDRLVADLPDGVLRMLDVSGIGPKTAYRICDELGVSTLEGLQNAILAGRLEVLPGMGKKTAENILRRLRRPIAKDGRILLGKALPIAERVCEAMRPLVPNVTEAGSLRRLEETVGDIDILGTSDDPAGAIEAFVLLPFVDEVLAHGPTKASVIVDDAYQVDLRIVEHESFGNLLQHFSGSKEHNVILRERARRMGLSVNEYGITDLATGKVERHTTEEEVYQRLGLPWIPPELRWGTDEIELAEQGRLPTLVALGDLKGDLHCHSEWSDGRDSLETVREQARAQGYDYLAITDHSSGRGVANGLTADRLMDQIERVHDLDRKADDGFRLLAGSEVDIRADGSLDFPDEALERLDVVVASIHSAMTQDRERMTARIITAMENPHVHVIGHLTARRIGDRPPVELDIDAILAAAQRTGTAIEINASPERLDLKDTYVRRARKLGVRLVVSSDAHSVSHLPGLRFGVGVARRGMCEAGDILNTRPLLELLAALKGSAPSR